MGDDLIKVEEVQSTALSTSKDLLELAITQGNLDINILERLMALREREQKSIAHRAYIKSMAMFQSKCPIIKRRKEGGRTSAGVVAYRYAPIEDMVDQTKELIAECGFCYFLNAPIEVERDGLKGVEVQMTISHELGHSEIFTQFMPYVTKTGVMSDPQVLGATQSYAKRYVFANGFGIMTGEDDTDAVGQDLTEKLKEYCEGMPNPVKVYLLAEAEKITSRKVYESWLLSLPDNGQLIEFTAGILPLVAKNKQDALWVLFMQQADKNKFLTNFKQSLTQEKK